MSIGEPQPGGTADGRRDRLKQKAAERALELVRDGMSIGIGTGTTARFFIQGLGRLVAGGMRLRGLPTSERSAQLARSAGVPLLDDLDGQLDLAIDGADEIAPDMDLIKGRGGALLREKLVATAARHFVVIADDSKLVSQLGLGLLPVEVVPYLWHQTAARLAGMGLTWKLRGGVEHPFVTDNGNLILDVASEGGIGDPRGLAAELKAQLGVVEHGLFLGIARGCLVAGEDGVRILGQP
jgi:ribose 5-phosphate isomerase A